MSTPHAPIYQINITLKNSTPPMWRRVLIPSETNLSKVHSIIQAAMGWYDCHVHAFEIHGNRSSAPSPYDPHHLHEMGMKSTHRVKLNTLLTAEGEKLCYDDDVGDDWHHEILLEKILPADPKHDLPMGIKGKRACPPEDVGGVWGYAEFLQALNDPEHPQHTVYTEWIGGDFDPEAFDRDTVNERLKGL